MKLLIRNLGTNEDDMEVNFDPAGEIISIHCYVSAIEAWVDLTERVLQNEYLVELAREEYDKRINEMLIAMAERDGNEY